MTWLFGLITSIPGMVNGVLTYLNKKQDTALEKFRVGDNNGRVVSIEILKGEIARVNAQKELNVIGMSHPIWWAGWALFVFPVGLYHACIFWVSTFPTLGWAIQKVPPDQSKAAYIIMMSFFGAHVASGVINSVLARWTK